MARKNSGSTPKGKEKPANHLLKEDYLILVNWLSLKTNFEACFGKSGKMSVGRPPVSSLIGFTSMAKELEKKSKARHQLSGRLMKDRWRTYYKKYQQAKDFEQATGSGLMEADYKKGIHSIEAKKEDICPFFKEMNRLFSNQPNITPLHVVDIQADATAVNSNQLKSGGDDDDEVDKLHSGSDSSQSSPKPSENVRPRSPSPIPNKLTCLHTFTSLISPILLLIHM